MLRNLAIVLALFSTAEVATAKLECELRMGVRKYMNWYTAGGAFVNALYDRPQAESILECKRCDRFGNKMGELHYALVDFEANRRYWVEKDVFTEASFFEGLSLLMQVFPIFTAFFNAMIAIVQDPVLLVYGLQYVFTFMADRDMPGLVLTRVPINWVTLYGILDTIPGADCYTLGSKLGLFVKVLTQVSLANEDESEIPDEIITNTINIDDDFIIRLRRRLMAGEE